MNPEHISLESKEIPSRPTRKLKDYINTFERLYEYGKRGRKFYDIADYLKKFFDQVEDVQRSYPFVGETIDRTVPEDKLAHLEEAITVIERAAQNGADFRLRASEQTTYDPGYSFRDSISGGVAGSSSTARSLWVYWKEPESQAWKGPSDEILDERGLALLPSSFATILEKLSDDQQQQLADLVQKDVEQLKKSGTYEDAIKGTLPFISSETQDDIERQKLAEEKIKEGLTQRMFVRMLAESIGSRFEKQPGLLAGAPAQEVVLSDLQKRKELLKRIAEKSQ